MKKEPTLTHTMHPQLKASDPFANVWVAASAGTGKTKTLIDRILRLLLSGSSASQIVCLTYTRAAAAEMKIRLHEKLAFWAKADTHILIEDISKLNEAPTPQALTIARTLLDQYLYADSHVKIQTLHAFCEEFLRKYALEEGISPFFEIMDSMQQEEMYTHSFDALLRMDKARPLLNLLSKYLSLPFLKELLNDYLSFEQRDGVSPHAPRDVDLGTCSFSLTSLSQEHVAAYQSSPKSSDQVIFQGLQKALQEEDHERVISILGPIFLTLSGDLRKSLGTKAIPGEVKIYMEALQLSFFTYTEHQKMQKLFMYSKTFHALGQLYQELLAQAKTETHLYTFSDIIRLSLHILQTSSRHPWVLLDLSQSISHLLIDEAQDTSPLQWKFLQEIIEIIFEETSTKHSSLFVVGDFKQSIYSFQGAQPEGFQKVFKSIGLYLQNQGYALERVELDTSFRSTSNVLSFVDQAFKGPLRQGVLEGEALIHHVHRSDLGKVGVLGPCPSPQDSALLIADIAARHGTQDIMILFRQRSRYVKKVLKEVEKLGILTSGLDRFNLLEDFAALDLLAIARFCANPLDDMVTALVLVGPLFAWSEEDLEPLCIGRETSLFMHTRVQDALLPLFQQSQKSCVLETFLWLLKDTGHSSRFLSIYGPQSAGMIDAFFKEIRRFEEDHPSSMQLFASWMSAQNVEIKREVSPNPGVLRPMTIHGSKGLEAKTIILLEADSAPVLRERMFLYKDTLFWTPQKDLWPQSFKELREAHKNKLMNEYNRLLYVALTRARDNLYILSSGEGGEHTWSSLLSDVWADLT